MRDHATSLKTLTRIAFCCLSLSLLLSSFEPPRAGAQRRRAPSQRPGAQRPAPRAAAAAPARMDFSHRRREHQLACDKCHKFPSENWKEVRKGDAAFPDVTQQPEHESCLGCHRQQFFARERPAPRICSVCHVAATPRNLARLPFPNPPEFFDQTPHAREFVSDFRIGFPHDKHLEVVGRLAPGQAEPGGVRFVTASFRRTPLRAPQESDPKSCAVCHQTYQPQGKSDEEYVTKPPEDLGEGFWLKKGTFKTAPNHASCFTCHSQDSGLAPAPGDCNACHKLAPPAARADFDPRLATAPVLTDGTILRRWRGRESSGTFRHEGGAHPDMSCTNCHNVGALNTLDPKTTKVPLDSCNTCHATATSAEGGALNLEIDRRKADPSFQCVKCHVAFGREPLPGTHAKAVAAPQQ